MTCRTAAAAPLRRRWLLAAGGGIGLAVLSGCASLSGDRSGAISGRLAMHVDASAGAPERNLSALFELKGSGDRGELQLTSPLGTGIAQARWQPRSATLVTSEGMRDYASLADLAEETLGEAIPLGALFDWLRGRPSADQPSQPLAGGEGFEQMGWTVDLARFGEGWVQIRRDRPPAVRMRVILEGA